MLTELIIDQNQSEKLQNNSIHSQMSDRNNFEISVRRELLKDCLFQLSSRIGIKSQIIRHHIEFSMFENLRIF